MGRSSTMPSFAACCMQSCEGMRKDEPEPEPEPEPDDELPPLLSEGGG